MTPPTMAGWKLGLRFALELGAITGLGAAAWRSTSGSFRWVAVLVVPAVAIAAWTVFNVPDDPSRSGAAPVVVSGHVRLVIELAILCAGAAAFTLHGPKWVGVVMGASVLLHYATTAPRLAWLLDT